MSDFMDKQKSEFDDFVSKWEKAIDQGIFKDPELPNVNPQTSNNSFFGFSNTNPTDSANASDSEYWKAIYAASDDHAPPDHYNGMINEEADHRSLPTNPVAKDTLGSDQEMNPQQLGHTFTEEEIEKLTELKKDLFDLENKLMTSMGFGDDKNQKKIESKIESVKKEINKISDDMGRPYKNENQPKHLENL